MLTLKNVSAGYIDYTSKKSVNQVDQKHDNDIIKNINLTIGENEVLGISGKNGSGKSTLAKSVINMVPNISGHIIFDGEDISKYSTAKIVERGMGYLIQGGRVFPHLSVEENLILSCGNLISEAYLERKEEILSLSALFEAFLYKNATLQASLLSGGERHQLALAMVLLRKPKLLILDEPSTGMDLGIAKELVSLINKIKDNSTISILLIEHNNRIARDLSDRIIKIKNGYLED